MFSAKDELVDLLYAGRLAVVRIYDAAFGGYKLIAARRAEALYILKENPPLCWLMSAMEVCVPPDNVGAWRRARAACGLGPGRPRRGCFKAVLELAGARPDLFYLA